jgi:hypothetical protein
MRFNVSASALETAAMAAWAVVAVAVATWLVSVL